MLVCDSKHSWRKDVFPFYKAHRKGDRDKQTHIDWSLVFKFFDAFKDELKTYLPYKFIEVEGAEGDDIIATLALQFTDQTNILVSTDKDFKQLQAYTKIKQFNPITWEIVPVESGFEYLQNHIIQGDRGDGIPNILSDDDTFVVEKKRQKRLTEVWLNYFRDTEHSKWDNERNRINWQRNKQLIDLRETPKYITDEILSSYYKQDENRKIGKLFDYFTKFNQVHFLDNMNDFRQLEPQSA